MIYGTAWSRYVVWATLKLMLFLFGLLLVVILIIHWLSLILFRISSTFIINICFIVFLYLLLLFFKIAKMVLWKSIPALTRVHGMWFYNILQTYISSCFTNCWWFVTLLTSLVFYNLYLQFTISVLFSAWIWFQFWLWEVIISIKFL